MAAAGCSSYSSPVLAGECGYSTSAGKCRGQPRGRSAACTLVRLGSGVGVSDASAPLRIRSSSAVPRRHSIGHERLRIRASAAEESTTKTEKGTEASNLTSVPTASSVPKNSEASTSGPPVLTIVAGVVVAALTVWFVVTLLRGIYSLLTWASGPASMVK